MKKLFTLFAFAAFLFPLISAAQDKKDPAVEMMEISRITGTPSVITFNETATYKDGDAAVAFAKYLPLRPGIDELRFQKTDAGEINVSRYTQYFKGIKVERGVYLSAARNGKIKSITGNFYAIDADLSAVPLLSEADARARALSLHGGSFADNSAELVFSADLLQSSPNGKVYLSYKFLMNNVSKAFGFEQVYIDANTGKLLALNSRTMAGCYNTDKKDQPVTASLKKSFSSSKNTGKVLSANAIAPFAASIYSGNLTDMVTRFVSGSYRLEATLATENYPSHTRNILHANLPSYTLVSQFTTAMAAATEFTDADNSWTAAEFANPNKDNTALDAYWGSQRVYDYWKNIHGRLSYNGTNGILNSFVHVHNNYNNAFWEGTTGIESMFYGDGSGTLFTTLTALDVTGHEIGHAVCQYTADLEYSKEPGAMNEGFSDIWGACIEHYADPHETDAVAKSYFDIGEEIGVPLPTPIRSMSNPKLRNQPDTYLGTNWVSTTTPTDVGGDDWGVHTNSGVLNKWFYLLVTGGTGTNDLGNAYAVSGLGWSKAEKIAYATELLLTNTSDYPDARLKSITAAGTLYGSCSAEVENVTRAWYAVGVGAAFTQCAPQIGFKTLTASVTENSGGFTCPGTKTFTIPMQVIPGLVPAGGNAVVTVTATGTATNGQDYTFAAGSATFNAGSTADQNIVLNILDDGNAEGNETVILDFTIAQNGSNVVKSGAFYQLPVTIIDDDQVPGNGVLSQTVPIGTTTVGSSAATPFRGASAAGRSQMIFTSTELTNAGLLTSRVINGITLHVTTKNSTAPYTGLTISIGNTAVNTIAGTINTGLTQVYSGNYSTVLGDNFFPFSPGFTWTAGQNIVVQFCWSNAAGTASDYVTVNLPGAAQFGFVDASSSGCTQNITNTSAGRPVVSFSQLLNAPVIESTISSGRSHTVSTGSNTYFYSSADGELIAAVAGNDKDLGCVSATVTAAGAGYSTLAGAPGTNRSNKEVTITPSTNITTASYSVTLYYTDAELTGATPSNLLLVKTTSPTDAGMTPANTVVHTPVMTSGPNYKAFTSGFTGFSRFFLVDNAFIVSLKELAAEAFMNNEHAVIRWRTTQEINSSYFIIERSFDGINFTELSRMNAAGNSSSEKQYSTNDPDRIDKKTYYRIRLMNADGSIKFSNIVSVNSSAEPGIAVVPNPVKDLFTLRYDHAGKGMILIIDAAGRKVRSLAPAGSSGTMTVDAGNLRPGLYLVMFTADDNTLVTEKFIKE